MSTDQYFATREAWLRAVLADKDLPASAFKVAFYLSLLANRKAFEERGVLEAWPGLQTIADGTALRKATVMDVIGRLKMAGWITVLPGKEGRGCHNTYQLTLKKGTESVPFNGVRFSDEKVRFSENKGTVSVPESTDRKTDTPPRGRSAAFGPSAHASAPGKPSIKDFFKAALSHCSDCRCEQDEVCGRTLTCHGIIPEGQYSKVDYDAMQPVVRVFTECGMCKVVAVEEWPLRAVVKFNKAKFNGKVGCPNCGGYSYKITEIEPIISDQNDEVPF